MRRKRIDLSAQRETRSWKRRPQQMLDVPAQAASQTKDRHTFSPQNPRLHRPFSPPSPFISPPPPQEEGKGTGQPITNKTDAQQEKRQREQPPHTHHHLSLSRMAPRLAFLLLLLAVACVTNSSAFNAVGSEVPVGLADFLVARGDGGLTESTRTCDGLLGQCTDEDEDKEMETETGISRRGLARSGQKFISYGALSKNRVPCNRRGQSYYNCSRGKGANPYRRGCSVITQCQRIFN